MQFATSSPLPQSLFSVSRERDPIPRRSFAPSKVGSRTFGNLDKSTIISIIRSKTLFKSSLNRRSPRFNERVFSLYSASFRQNYVILILSTNDIAMKLVVIKCKQMRREIMKCHAIASKLNRFIQVCSVSSEIDYNFL